jgi:cardiolipin synthase
MRSMLIAPTLAQARPLHIVILLAGIGQLLSCASEPRVDTAIEDGADTRQTVVGAHGPLSERQVQAILARIDKQQNGTDLLQRHLAVEQAVADSPLFMGNRTAILRDGVATFRAMFQAIRSAKRSIDLEYYIFEDVESDGDLGDLLIAKRAAGVTINILYDSYGSMDTPNPFLDRLKAAGINVLEFNPLNPFRARDTYSLNERDHRKILTVDGALAIMGGVNLYTAYQPHPNSGLVKSAGPANQHMRDTDLLIEGPAVLPLEQLFVDHWRAQKGPPIEANDPAPPAKGTEIIRIIGSDHTDPVPHFYATLISAIRDADKSIWMSTAYFVPTHEEVEALVRAARRGVDVRLLLPSTSDSDQALAAGRSNYEDLLEAGVRIFETQDETLHAKTAVIDGVWSVIGSSNLDHRSVLYNDEVDAVALGRDTAKQLEAQFADDQRLAKAIDPQSWNGRPLGQKLHEFYARFWQNLL